MNDNPTLALRFTLLLIVFSWSFYLLTVAPTIFYRDAPEFVNTAFTLGISHPAGFPIYNMMAKTITLVPLGSIAFRVNLFSALAGVAAVVFLFWTAIRFLRVMFGPENTGCYLWAALLPVGFMAFCKPFWWNTMLAEVYTLHTFFTVLIFYFLFWWKEREDARYLFMAALVYGLSAGNHGTVAFYLPAILILFFAWNRTDTLRNLAWCVVFFLVGFAVYVYLPVRSLADPSFDWGNPETWEGFLYQVTDRKDQQGHFAALNPGAPAATALQSVSISLGSILVSHAGKAWFVVSTFLGDLQRNLSPVSAVAFVLGTLLCARRFPALCLFFLIIVGSNTSFFIEWQGEAFLPSYVITTLLTAAVFYQLFFGVWMRPQDQWRWIRARVEWLRDRFGLRWRNVGYAGMALFIPWAQLTNYYKVDRSNYYLAETFTRNIYLSLEDRSLFIPGLSWFYYYYNQDVRRLRDDVTAVPVWDLISPEPPIPVTQKRFPHLQLPDSSHFDRRTKESISKYVGEFLRLNAPHRPVLLEQCFTFYEETELTERFQPYRHVLLRYVPEDVPPIRKVSGQATWEEYKALLESELARPRAGMDMDWLNVPEFLLISSRMYYHDTLRYAEEREVLALAEGFLGKRDAVWRFMLLDNLILDGKLDRAREILSILQSEFPGTYEMWMGQGLMARASGFPERAIESLERAATLRPDKFRPYLELFITFRQLGDEARAAQAVQSARSRVTSMKDLRLLRQALADWPSVSGSGKGA